jgi:chorismate synthase
MAGNTFGRILSLTTFGESHGAAIGGVLDGFPPGISIDPLFIRDEMNRRRPGTGEFSSPRKEEDEVEILSGIFEGRSTGAPIAFIVFNRDKKPEELRHP